MHFIYRKEEVQKHAVQMASPVPEMRQAVVEKRFIFRFDDRDTRVRELGQEWRCKSSIFMLPERLICL